MRLRLGPNDIDGGGVKRVLDVRGVELLDHLHAGAAVLGNLIDIRPLREPHADVNVAQAVGRAIGWEELVAGLERFMD